ncbi:MAG: N-acetyl-gamma-glutamyl-phosphate reductase [Anaerolineae bacterium]|nr:N-acetyl-gamma-glutamyl-phosphate reductase [Anaerolineae bacterium]
MTERVIRAGVYGASGYAGLDLVELLARHPQVTLVFATSSTFVGEPVPGTDLRYIHPDDAVLAGVEVVFLALPHKASARVARQARDAGVRVLDLSADLRLKTAEDYQKWYGEAHPHPELLPVPYGLPELHREELRGADIIACPGCYPTTTLLGLYPLLRIQGLALEAPIIVDAKSGVSGAGRNPTDKTHFVEVYSNLTPYNTGRSHRHVGEMEQEIRRFIPLSEPLIFTPHLLPVDRGLMASIYVTLNYNITADKIHSLYNNVYGDEPLVTVLPAGKEATLRHVVRTNRCVISLTPVTYRYVHITSVTDNLRKGAAGQAVQCLNLMFDLPETLALL